MSDRELNAIRRNRLRELKNKLAARNEKGEEMDADAILNRLFKGRAWEVFNAAAYQFPEIAKRVKDALVTLAISGRLKELTGEQLYVFLRSLGLRVRLNTKIRYTENGKFTSLSEKLKKDLQSQY
jgi:DNA-binding TFAR19-related protein (PDSD5 family)